MSLLSTKLLLIWNAIGLPGVLAVAAVAGLIAYIVSQGRKSQTLLEYVADRVSPHPNVLASISDRLGAHPSVTDRVAQATQPVIHAVDDAIDGLGPRLTHAPAEAWDVVKNNVLPS